MNLLRKAQNDAKQNGTKVSSETAKGLKAVQTMHNMCKRSKGSPYRTYTASRKVKKN